MISFLAFDSGVHFTGIYHILFNIIQRLYNVMTQKIYMLSKTLTSFTPATDIYAPDIVIEPPAL